MECINTGIHIPEHDSDDFYADSKRFPIYADIIATTKKRQFNFQSRSWHKYDSTFSDINFGIVNSAVADLGYYAKEDVLPYLVKVSSCVYLGEKYRPTESIKIDKATAMQSGKWWFQPDQRCESVKKVVEANPRIAMFVIPFAEEVFAR